MKNKLGVLFAALLLALSLGGAAAVVATPAAAATGTCTHFGTFQGQTSFHRSGSTNQSITFDWATVSFVTAGSGLEYRVRWYAVNGTTLLYDSGYSTAAGARSASVFPGTNRAMGPGSSVLINAGALNDGQATCEIWLGVN